MQRTTFLSFRTIFCTLTVLTTQKIKNLKKIKKTPRDIILHKCIINDNLMMYCSWDIRHDRQKFLSFYFLTIQKIKILKEWKKHLEISSFHKYAPKIMIICYAVPEIWHMTHVILIFHFGLFLPFYPLPPPPPPLTAQKIKISKNERKAWRYHHFTQVYQILWLDDVWFLKYGARQADGQMDGWKKWHIEVGTPHKNLESWD